MREIVRACIPDAEGDGGRGLSTAVAHDRVGHLDKARVRDQAQTHGKLDAAVAAKNEITAVRFGLHPGVQHNDIIE